MNDTSGRRLSCHPVRDAAARLRRRRVLGTTLGFMWLAATPATGQSPAAATPPAPTDAIVRANVDLGARAFDRVLPFDVPFFIVGTPPERTETLRVYYREITKDGAAAGDWRPPNGLDWSATGPITADTKFAVLLRLPLEAERYYEFVFRFQRAPDQKFMDDFQPVARDVLDSGLQTLLGKSLSLEDAIRLRALFVSRLRQRTQDRGVIWEPRPNSLFDVTATSPAALAAFIDAANGVLGPQDDRQTLLGTFSEVRPRLANAVSATHQHPDLRSFVSRIAVGD